MKVGDTLVCVMQNSGFYIGGEEDNERLIIGEKYKITDIDGRFHNKVCIRLKGPYYFHEEWVPVECFSDIQSIRNYKIEQILK
jgi:biotin synthase-related radical SAM superfamily protein